MTQLVSPPPFFCSTSLLFNLPILPWTPDAPLSSRYYVPGSPAVR